MWIVLKGYDYKKTKNKTTYQRVRLAVSVIQILHWNESKKIGKYLDIVNNKKKETCGS